MENDMQTVLTTSSNGESLDSTTDESRPLIGSDVTQTYWRRWYLLAIFSLCTLVQTLTWATWGPISQSAEAAFSWHDSDIALFVWMGNVPFAILCIPMSWVMDHKGLRLSMLFACVLMALGAGLRCLTHFITTDKAIWVVYGGQFLNGMAGPVVQGGGALFSNLWFPPGQRATSTAISTFIGYMGNSLAFVLGPALVRDPSTNANGTVPNTNTTVVRLTLQGTNDTVIDNYADVRKDILSYLYYQAIAAGALLLLVFLYFPDKPPRPPSLSAAVEREDFKPGLIMLVKNKQFWLISLAYSIPLGVYEVWDIVLDVNLNAIGISQDLAGWMGFYSVIGGCATGFVISRFADIFFRQLKLFMVLAYLVSAVFVLWFILIYIGILPTDTVSIYAAIILSGVFLDGCCPLFYELVCEAAYPVGEGVSSCFLQMLCVIAGMCFASVQQIPDVGTTWMNWCLLGTICAALPLLLCTKETFSRADVDDQEVIIPPDNPSTQREHARKEANGYTLLAGDDDAERGDVRATSPRDFGAYNVRLSPAAQRSYGAIDVKPSPVGQNGYSAYDVRYTSTAQHTSQDSYDVNFSSAVQYSSDSAYDVRYYTAAQNVSYRT